MMIDAVHGNTEAIDAYVYEYLSLAFPSRLIELGEKSYNESSRWSMRVGGVRSGLLKWLGANMDTAEVNAWFPYLVLPALVVDDYEDLKGMLGIKPALAMKLVVVDRIPPKHVKRFVEFEIDSELLTSLEAR
jgi:hypothetical protein